MKISQKQNIIAHYICELTIAVIVITKMTVFNFQSFVWHKTDTNIFFTNNNHHEQSI